MATTSLPEKPGVWNHLRLVIVLALAVLAVAIVGGATIMSRHPQETVNQVDKGNPEQPDGTKHTVDGTGTIVN